MDSRRLRTLNPLRTFLVAAREGGFAAAADRLALTHAAVSKQISGLEQDLGARLFERSPRAVRLTAEGRELHRRLEAVFADLDVALGRFSGTAPRCLTVSCEPTLCAKLLIPLMPLTDDDRQVQILAAGGPVDFVRHGVDVAFRRDDFPIDADVPARVLVDELTGPVASPALLAEDGSRWARAPTAVHARTRPDAWSWWLHRTGLPNPARRDAVYDNHLLAIQAACAGQGVAMLSLFMIADELADGRLVAPFGFTPDGSRYLALSRVPLNADPALEALVGRVHARLRAIACDHAAPGRARVTG